MALKEKIAKEVVDATCDCVTTIGGHLIEGVSDMIDGGGPEDVLMSLIEGVGEQQEKFFDGTMENIDNFFKPLEAVADFLDDIFNLF